MKSQIDTYDKIYTQLQSRLNKKGIITTNEAWTISKHSYAYVSKVFRNIMDIMVKKGFAEKIVNGKWMILVAGKC